VVSAEFVPIFEQEYRALRPRAPMPPFTVRFRRFTSLNTPSGCAKARFTSAFPICLKALRKM